MNPKGIVERLLVTDSTMNKTFMECMRKGFWAYVANWQPIVRSHHLTYGIAIHKAAEVLNTKGFARENVQEAFEAFCSVYDADVPPEVDVAKAPKDRAAARRMLELLTERYSDVQYKTAMLDGKPLVEVFGSIPFKMTTSLGDMNAELRYKIDAVKTDSTRVYVWDYKSAGKETLTLDDEYALNSQMNNYNIALHSLFPPEVVGGVMILVLLFRKGREVGPKGQKTIEGGLDIHPVKSVIPPEMLESRINNMVSWKQNIIEEAIKAEAQHAAGQPLTAFPMNDGACFKWGSRCPYFNLCRYRSDVFGKMDLIPGHLQVNRWEPGGAITNAVED